MELLRKAFTHRQYITLPGINATLESGTKKFVGDQAISKASKRYAMLANIAGRLIQPQGSPAYNGGYKMFLISTLKNLGSDQSFLDELSVELEKIRLYLSNNSSALISHSGFAESKKPMKVLRKDEP